MKKKRRSIRPHMILCLLGSAALVATAAPDLQAQQAAHAHIEHVRSGFGATPDGAGLLPTALAEAEVAATHARLAGRDQTNLEAMQTHARHVLHAVDPSRIDGGPGAGFGVKQAAEGIAQHIELAADVDGASGNVTTHAGHVASAARAVAARADEVAETVAEIQDAYDYTEASSGVGRLQILVGQLVEGADVNEDGSVSWQEPEGGLQHVEQHVGLMASGEGLD